MTSNQINVHSGYLIFVVLLGMQSIMFVSLNNNQNWVPDVVLEPGPVIFVSSSSVTSKKECEEIPLDVCYQKLQTFLKLTSLPFTSDKAELDSFCSNVVGGYNCSTQKMNIPYCLSPTDKSLFPVFVDMAQYTMFMFCYYGNNNQPGYLRDVLLENSDCILKQKDALDCCAKQSKVPDLPVLNIMEDREKSLAERQISACCPVSYYMKCVETVIIKNCGEVGGNLTTEYIRRAAGEEIQEVCQNMPNYPYLDEGVCNDTPRPVCSGTRIGIFVELTALMSLLYIMWISHL